MGETTGIAWTDHTWNPWMGCQRVSPGCAACYAETLVTGRMGLPVWGPPSTTARKRTSTENWKNPGRWHRAALRAGVRRRVFVASLADVFEDHPDLVPWRAEALAILAQCTALDVQLLTKRPENVRRMVPASWLENWPAHIWIGCTVEDQRRADERIPELLKVPAAVRFLSCEPLLEAVDLSRWLVSGVVCPECDGYGEDVSTGETCERCSSGVGPGERVSWVIVGGESGPDARRFDLGWAESVLRQCRDSGTPTFVKQLGTRPTGGVWRGRVPHERDHPAHRGVWVLRHPSGADPSEWPEGLRVQQFPEVPRG